MFLIFATLDLNVELVCINGLVTVTAALHLNLCSHLQGADDCVWSPTFAVVEPALFITRALINADQPLSDTFTSGEAISTVPKVSLMPPGWSTNPSLKWRTVDWIHNENPQSECFVVSGGGGGVLVGFRMRSLGRRLFDELEPLDIFCCEYLVIGWVTRIKIQVEIRSRVRSYGPAFCMRHFTGFFESGNASPSPVSLRGVDSQHWALPMKHTNWVSCAQPWQSRDKSIRMASAVHAAVRAVTT